MIHVRPLAAAIAAVLVACSARSDGVARARPAPAIPTAVFWLTAPIEGDPSPLLAHVPRTGAVLEGTYARLLRPTLLPVPRRVGIQAGHWKAEEAPSEFPHLAEQIGGEQGGIREVDLTVDIANRVVALLGAKGVAVDLLPATIPPSYLADAFVALHADGDETAAARGFKTASGFYRGPYDAELARYLTEEYASATGLPWDDHVTGDMTDYYAFAWYRYDHALAPHTPGAIIELGFFTSRDDRAILVDRPEVAAEGVANAVLRFLASEPQSALFGSDILVATVPAPATPSPSASPHNP